MTIKQILHPRKKLKRQGLFAARFGEVTLNTALPTDVLAEAAHRCEFGKLGTFVQSCFITWVLPRQGFSLCLSPAGPCAVWQEVSGKSSEQDRAALVTPAQGCPTKTWQRQEKMRENWAFLGKAKHAKLTALLLPIIFLWRTMKTEKVVLSSCILFMLRYFD